MASTQRLPKSVDERSRYTVACSSSEHRTLAVRRWPMALQLAGTHTLLPAPHTFVLASALTAKEKRRLGYDL
eukprot:6174480-Pleurochrysis_carterae.AAC.4